MSETVPEPPPEPDDPEPWCLSASDGADEPSAGTELLGCAVEDCVPEGRNG